MFVCAERAQRGRVRTFTQLKYDEVTNKLVLSVKKQSSSSSSSSSNNNRSTDINSMSYRTGVFVQPHFGQQHQLPPAYPNIYSTDGPNVFETALDQRQDDIVPNYSVVSNPNCRSIQESKVKQSIFSSIKNIFLKIKYFQKTISSVLR